MLEDKAEVILATDDHVVEALGALAAPEGSDGGGEVSVRVGPLRGAAFVAAMQPTALKDFG